MRVTKANIRKPIFNMPYKTLCFLIATRIRARYIKKKSESDNVDGIWLRYPTKEASVALKTVPQQLTIFSGFISKKYK